MADPVKPDLSPIEGGSTAGKAVATGAAKAAAGGVAKVAAWHTISLATAAALGLGGGGIIFIATPKRGHSLRRWSSRPAL